jgi:hypothetical protein
LAQEPSEMKTPPKKKIRVNFVFYVKFDEEVDSHGGCLPGGNKPVC